MELTPQHLIEEAAQAQLSNFDGADDTLLGFDGWDNYIGENDPMIDFGGGPSKSFADPIAKQKVFTMNLKNLDAVNALTCYLTPGLNLFDARVPLLGLAKTGTFSDALGIGNNNMSASGSPTKIETFQAFIQQFPTTIVGMKISASDPLQIEQNFLLEIDNPFQKKESKSIYVSLATDETANKDKVATVYEKFELGSDKRLSYLLVPGASVTIQMICGASVSLTKALDEKQNRAMKNINRLGGPQNVAALRSRRKR